MPQDIFDFPRIKWQYALVLRGGTSTSREAQGACRQRPRDVHRRMKSCNSGCEALPLSTSNSNCHRPGM